MLTQPVRELLIVTTLHAIPNWQDCRTLVESVRLGVWAQAVPLQTSYRQSFEAIVGHAEGNDWLRSLVQSLVAKFAARVEFARVLAEIDKAAPPPTAADPFEEVLLEADRPFVNRGPLRSQVRSLTGPNGASVLLIDGEPQTGKSFSYYLINHVASKQGYVVHRFRMSALQRPDELTLDILGRLCANPALPPQGQESAERWAGKLADAIARSIEAKKSPRLFVFDEFSDTPLPEGTASLIIRLATYADEELRPYLRVVAMRFRAPLPDDLDQVALRDDEKPFTATDMVSVVMQIATARNWKVTDAAVKKRIDDFHQTPRGLKERFKFLRGLLQELGAPK